MALLDPDWFKSEEHPRLLQSLNNISIPVSDFSVQAVINKWKGDLENGTPWPKALFKAIGDWPLMEEQVRGRNFKYLIDNEAFDWLLLAERLLSESEGMVPTVEVESLLFNGELPFEVTAAEIELMFGSSKYRAHLNYFYGVVLEEALWLAVESDLIKKNGVMGFSSSDELESEVFVKLYGVSLKKLMSRFYKTKGRRLPIKHQLGDLKAFTYWCFKRRISNSDSSKVASDTKRGLQNYADLRSRAFLTNV